jgi:large subunit ribosomal protein L4
MQVAVKDITGKELKKIDLPDEIYGRELNEHVLHQVVKAQLANRRQGTHSVKTRSFVSGSGHKPFRQKGTGNARQGSTRSPHYPGGAVAHGPAPRDYRQKVNRKLKKLALQVALSDKVRHGKFVVVDDLGVKGYSTKHVGGALQALEASHALVADQRDDDLVYKSTRNLRTAAYRSTLDLNVEDVLRYESFVITEKALEALNNRLGGGADASV